MIPLSSAPVHGGRSREAFERVVAACEKMIRSYRGLKTGGSDGILSNGNLGLSNTYPEFSSLGNSLSSQGTPLSSQGNSSKSFAALEPFAVINEESGRERELLLPACVREGTAVVLRTSGSTGGAKFVELSFEALAYSASATHKELGGEGTWVSCLPSDHIAGFQTIFRSLLCGNRPVFAGGGSPQELAEVVRRCREQDMGETGQGSHQKERLYLSLVPTQLKRLLDSDYVEEALYFDAILVGGAASSSALLRHAREAGLAIRTSYGMTETCGGCVYDGFPLGNTRIQIRQGRIHLEGSCVALGYAQGEAFNGVFLTNDYGALHEGKLQVLGRVDDAITTGGATIMPHPIEELLVELGAGEALCTGIPSSEWGQAVIALTLHRIDETHARTIIATRLGREWAPRRIISTADLGLSSLPCTPSGKPSRRETAKLVASFLNS